jgi:hypothetical protein
MKRWFLKQSAPRDSIHGGIKIEPTNPVGNIYASRVVTAGIDGVKERIVIHRPMPIRVRGGKLEYSRATTNFKSKPLLRWVSSFITGIYVLLHEKYLQFRRKDRVGRYRAEWEPLFLRIWRTVLGLSESQSHSHNWEYAAAFVDLTFSESLNVHTGHAWLFSTSVDLPSTKSVISRWEITANASFNVIGG